MLPKKANVKFFPVTKDEYSHKKSHAIFVVHHAIFYAIYAKKTAVAGLRKKIPDLTIQR